MTYDEAKCWLAEVGGRMIEAKEQIRGRGSIIVAIENGRRGWVQRHRLFDDTLAGHKRELAIQAAFLRACDDLEKALSVERPAELLARANEGAASLEGPLDPIGAIVE